MPGAEQMTDNCVRTHTFHILFSRSYRVDKCNFNFCDQLGSRTDPSAIGRPDVLRDTLHIPDWLHLIKETMAVIHPH
jgi:hypothetical protein